MTAAALLLAAAAMLLVRLGWGRRRRLAALGWAMAVVALAMLTVRNGAWGLAMGSVAGMAAALTLVLHAGWRSPRKSYRAAREAPSVTIPHRWPDLARRLAVFALVVPIGFAAAQWLAFGIQALARRGGAVDADAIVLALFLQPVLWGIIMAIQMTRAGPVRMIASPVAAALLGTVLWGAA